MIEVDQSLMVLTSIYIACCIVEKCCIAVFNLFKTVTIRDVVTPKLWARP